MARLHAAAFLIDRAWRASEFTDLLASPFVHLFTVPDGLALTRTVARETELLTLAVHPAAQSRGKGQHLMDQWINTAKSTADSAFIEVAADNAAALRLYLRTGFEVVSTRPTYYRRADGSTADALIMRRALS